MRIGHRGTQRRKCCPVRGVLIAIASAFLFLLPPSIAQAQPIDEVVVYGYGNYMPIAVGWPNVTQTANGIPSAVQYFPVTHTITYSSGPAVVVGGPYYANSVTIPGSPGVVDVDVMMYREEWVAASYFIYNDAILNFDVSTGTGMVTLTVNGDNLLALGDTVTLTVDSSSSTQIMGGVGHVISVAGDISDRTLSICATFPRSPAQIRACVTVYLIHNLPRNVPDPPASHAALRDFRVEQNYVYAIRRATEQLSLVMLQQIQAIGTLLDAKHQVETQRILSAVQAQAHRDYQPSEMVCAMGTLARSSALSTFRVTDNVRALQTILQKRELLSGYSASNFGPYADLAARRTNLWSIYCDPHDSDRSFQTFCTSPAGERRNRDIDYAGLVDKRLTLDVDFTNNVDTPEEADIIALSNNLYAHELPVVIPKGILTPPNNNFSEMADWRSLTAIRGVARHSYATIVGLKSSGTGLTLAQIRQVMTNLGVAAADMDRLIGANPSYFAQMEIMTQKVFQDPTFFVNLYDTPANVDRMNVSMLAVRIMSDNEKLEALTRREMLFSLILEMKLREAEKAVSNQIGVTTRKTIR